MSANDTTTTVSRFRWKVPHALSLSEAHFHSPVFEAHGRRWQLWIWPNRDYNSGNYLSAYVRTVEEDEDEVLEDWSLTCGFTIGVVDSRDDMNAFCRTFRFNFKAGTNYMGWETFLRTQDLTNPDLGFIADDGTLTVEVELTFWGESVPHALSMMKKPPHSPLFGVVEAVEVESPPSYTGQDEVCDEKPAKAAAN